MSIWSKIKSGTSDIFGAFAPSTVKRDGMGKIVSGDSLFPPAHPMERRLGGGDATTYFSSIVQIAMDVLINGDVSYRSNQQMATQMVRDVMLMQPVERRMIAVCSQEFIVEADDDAPPSHRAAAKEIDTQLRAADRIIDLFKALSWAVWRGLGAAEINWVNRDAKFIPAGFRIINGDKITFDRWGNPRILTIDFQYGGRELSKEELSRMILHRWEPDDGDFYEGQQADIRFRGRGLRDRVWPYWWLRQNAVKMWVQFIERKATGFIIGRYPSGNAQAQATMEQILQNLLSNSKVLLPTTGNPENEYGIESVAMSGASESVSIFREFCEDFAARYIRIYIQGEDQANQTSGDGLGSGRAQALQSMFKLYTDYDSTVLEQTITSQLVQPMARYNYADAMPSLRFRFIRESLDYNEAKLRLDTAREIGLSVPAAFARKVLGLPEPQEGEETLDMSMAPQGPQPAPPGGPASPWG